MEKTKFLLISLGIAAGTMLLTVITQKTPLGYLFFGAFTINDDKDAHQFIGERNCHYIFFNYTKMK